MRLAKAFFFFPSVFPGRREPASWGKGAKIPPHASEAKPDNDEIISSLRRRVGTGPTARHRRRVKSPKLPGLGGQRALSAPSAPAAPSRGRPDGEKRGEGFCPRRKARAARSGDCGEKDPLRCSPRGIEEPLQAGQSGAAGARRPRRDGEGPERCSPKRPGRAEPPRAPGMAGPGRLRAAPQPRRGRGPLEKGRECWGAGW